jgi:hypothetical protein
METSRKGDDKDRRSLFDKPDVRAPDVKMPTRPDIFGKPEAPLGMCNRCRKNFPIPELQKYFTNPQEAYWLCAKCAFKKRLKEKLSGTFR